MGNNKLTITLTLTGVLAVGAALLFDACPPPADVAVEVDAETERAAAEARALTKKVQEDVARLKAERKERAL